MPDKIKREIRAYLDATDVMDSSLVHRLLAYAMTYIETLEGLVASDPRRFLESGLSRIRDICAGYMNCSECPLSDADGDCPFIAKTGSRLLPSDWELERMCGQNEEP